MNNNITDAGLCVPDALSRLGQKVDCSCVRSASVSHRVRVVQMKSDREAKLRLLEHFGWGGAGATGRAATFRADKAVQSLTTQVSHRPNIFLRQFIPQNTVKWEPAASTVCGQMSSCGVERRDV